MIPQTDIHKLLGFVAASMSMAAAKYGFDLPTEIAFIIANGAYLLVSTLVGKATNPTGANRSDVRQVMESQVAGVTGEHPVSK